MHILKFITVTLFLLIPVFVLGQAQPPIEGAEYRERNYPNGRPMYKGYFVNDKPVGEMKRYYENGALQAVLQYGAGNGVVKAQLYFDNGNMAAEGNYIDMQRDSIWRFYGSYTKMLTLTETYKMGVRNGPMIHYYAEGGILDSVNQVNGVRQGEWKEYFPDRTVKKKGSFVNDRLEGYFQVNYLNGSPYIKGSYKNDLPDGKWVFYNEDGSVNAEMNYSAGVNLDKSQSAEKQEEFFRMIEENRGRFDEPDEMDFLR